MDLLVTSFGEQMATTMKPLFTKTFTQELPALSSPNHEFIEYEGYLYFSAFQEFTGHELWRTNDAETTLVKDINPGGNNEEDTPNIGRSSYPRGFTEFNGWLYFTTTMTWSPSFLAPIVDKLWRTNGSVTK
jgi:ELWxxDGT repeat protein